MFFFFKQKTAYEMRISDWSSDVCSSDLDLCALPGNGQISDGERARRAIGRCRFRCKDRDRRVRSIYHDAQGDRRRIDQCRLPGNREELIGLIWLVSAFAM